MLCLTRKIKEAIIIDKDIEIIVNDIIIDKNGSSKRVKLGINAPKDKNIIRKELLIK